MELDKLWSWRVLAGPYYGTEDQCLFLYSLVKMYRPQRVLELGAGLGVSSFWIAQALRENGVGHLFAIDDGSHWRDGPDGGASPRLQAFLQRARQSEPFAAVLAAREPPDYFEFLDALRGLFGLEEQVSFLAGKVDLEGLRPVAAESWIPQLARQDIDLLYSDFSHGPEAVLSLLARFLPRMASCSSLLIDSASTFWLSYLILERTVEQLNAGKVPQALIAGADDERCRQMMQLAATRRFSLTHMVECKDRTQNGLAWLKIEPVNVVPYPLTAMRRGDRPTLSAAQLRTLFEPGVAD